jgi:hypothetical protein
MKPFMRNLKVRVLVAVVAIAIVHVAFYATPRWWYSRARVYDGAYRRAVAVLTEEFGEAALKDGPVAIPRMKISVPYRGQATICNEKMRAAILYLDRPGKDSYLLYQNETFDLEAAALSSEQARTMWATLEYLSRVIVAARMSPPGTYYPEKVGGFVDRTLGSRGIRYVISDQYEYSAPAVAMRRAAWERAFFRLVSDMRFNREIQLVDAAKLVPAMRTVVAASLPADNCLDAVVARVVLRPYLEQVGKEDLPILKRIEATRGVLGMLVKLPFVGPRLKAREERLARYAATSLAADIWAAQMIAGKSDEDAFQTLVRATGLKGNVPYTRDQCRKAGWLLTKRWPRRWGDLLADNYQSLPGGSNAFSFSLRDDRLTRLVAADPQSSIRMSANMTLFEKTGAAQFMRGVLEAAEKAAVSDPQFYAVTWIFEQYGKDHAACDAPAFARRVLRSVTRKGLYEVIYGGWPATTGYESLIVRLLGETPGDECAQVLLDVALQPDAVLNPALSADDRAGLMKQAAMVLTSRAEPLVSDALAAYLDGARPPQDAGAALLSAGALVDAALPKDEAVVFDSILALRRHGGPKALPALEKLIAAEAAKDPAGAAQSPPDMAKRVGLLRIAAMAVAFRSAADHVRALAAIDEKERVYIDQGDLAQACSVDELKAIIENSALMDMREKASAALMERSRQAER